MNNEVSNAVLDCLKIALQKNEDPPTAKTIPRPQMRTLPQAIKQLKAEDPGCCFTLPALRRCVKQGRIPCVHVQTKTLVDLNKIYSYLEKCQGDE